MLEFIVNAIAITVCRLAGIYVIKGLSERLKKTNIPKIQMLKM